MELKQLEAFVSVADAKSFSGAAQVLYLTQPTVSAHVAALEKELGLRLFERTTKSVRLTEGGQSIYAYAKRMLELKTAIELRAGDSRQIILTVAASTVPGTYLLPEVLSRFSCERPEVAVKIIQGNSSEVEELVADGAAEIGFIGRLLAHSGLESLRICDDRLVLVTPVNDYYTKIYEQGADIARYLEEPLILREDGSGTQQFVDKVLAFLPGNRKLNIAIRSNNQESIKRMVTAGRGVSIMSFYAAAELEKQGLVRCFPIDISENRSFYGIYRRNAGLGEEAAYLLEMVRKTAGSHTE